MSSVFLSYDREDADRARAVALVLEKAGHSVWWDRHIKGGAQYSHEIEQALKRADAVVVLWSNRSIHSAWVRDEAAAGRDSGRLVPVLIEETEPPLGFRQYQSIDLSRWKGRGRPAGVNALLETVESLAGGAPADERPAPVRPERRRMQVRTGPVLIAAVLALVAAAALAFWQPWRARASVPVVAIGASDSSAGSRALARDLLIKLGSLQGARPARIVEAGGGPRADLILEAGETGAGGGREASLALLAGEDRSLIWSKQFGEQAGSEANVAQQVAHTAAQALDCALQALSDEQAELTPEVLKLFLNGCVAMEELSYLDLQPLIPVFREVTRQAPTFVGGWAKLVQVEVLTYINGGRDPALLPPLKQHIAQARRLNPHLAEAYLAEMGMLPTHAYGERLRLIDLATRHNPHHPEPFAARYYALGFVGRYDESARSAERAVELNPLSPQLRIDLISALTYSGQFDRARQEIEKAERLWPGTRAIAGARYRFNLHYGDPREALREQGFSTTLWSPRLIQAYLKARVEPTPANVEAAIGEAQALIRREARGLLVLVQMHGTFNRENELLPILLAPEPSELPPDIPSVLFRPALRELLFDRRFMQVAKRLRLIDYWASSGKWPDFCFDPDLPYDCKTEAAKVQTS